MENLREISEILGNHLKSQEIKGIERQSLDVQRNHRNLGNPRKSNHFFNQDVFLKPKYMFNCRAGVMSAVFADAGFGGFLIICNTLLLLAEKLTPPIAPMDCTSVGTNFAKSVINLQKR